MTLSKFFLKAFGHIFDFVTYDCLNFIVHFWCLFFVKVLVLIMIKFEMEFIALIVDKCSNRSKFVSLSRCTFDIYCVHIIAKFICDDRLVIENPLSHSLKRRSQYFFVYIRFFSDIDLISENVYSHCVDHISWFFHMVESLMSIQQYLDSF